MARCPGWIAHALEQYDRLVREFVSGGRAMERGLFDAAYLRRLAEERAAIRVIGRRGSA